MKTKQEEFDLSKSMYKDNDDCNDLLAFYSVEDYFLKEDVKEFIKQLKEKGFELSQEKGQSGDKKFILISEEDLDELTGEELK